MTRRSLGAIVAMGLATLGVAVGSDLVGGQDREPLVAEGRRLFTEKGCYGCHTVGATGTPIAPDLTHVGARYDETRLARWLQDPAAQDPTRHMPNLRLTETEAKALATYLASLR